jgi:hypothetical protein
MGFHKDPSQLAPDDPQWRQDRSNLDVVRTGPIIRFNSRFFLHKTLTVPHRSSTVGQSVSQTARRPRLAP